ncbi:glycosyltransferase family 2 protein [Ferruginibacter sp.]|nr:glycosyltransferase family 2 protein [Ferruginibacter sp.]
MLISIIIPVYQAENILEELVSRIKKSMKFAQGDYQLVLVDDGSADASWHRIENICATEKNIKAIKLSRNFGQHHAITAGLDHCTGERVVVMDCDLQDNPEEIQRLYQKAQEGFEIVFARRIHRKDSFSKKILSRIFYKLFSYLTGIKYDGKIGNFGIYSMKVIDTLKRMKEPLRAFSPMVRWVGFSKAFIDVEHSERYKGKSTYNYGKIITLASDIILSYSDKPLRLIVRLGFLISCISFFVGIYYFIQYLAGRIFVSGYTSIIISIWFLGGLMILNLGVLGLYISKIFTGIKDRPLYIIDKTINF